MSTEAVTAILSRAVAEPAFRAVLLHTPAQALTGYPLTAAELATLSALQPENFDASAATLEKRESRVSYDPALHIALPTQQANGTITDHGIASAVVLAHE